MSIDLYYSTMSGPCRAVQMTAQAVGVSLNLIFVDLMNKEQLKPEFIKLNPQHTIPTLIDSNGFSIWESRAIMTYLVDKYGKDDSLYPKDPEKRATINQRLYFDMGTFYQSFKKCFLPKVFTPNAPEDPETMQSFENAVGFLEEFLENTKYVAGDTLTLADISLAVSTSYFQLANYDIGKYKNISRWYELCKQTIPGWEINEAGIVGVRQHFEKRVQQQQQEQN